MPSITIGQLQKRTRHELISDNESCCNDPYVAPSTVRNAEREREARYPLHGQLRKASIRYFKENGWDVHPHGVGVWGAKGVLADLAISKGQKIILIECVSPWEVYRWKFEHKNRLSEFLPVWFVIQHPSVAKQKPSYIQRVKRFARWACVFTWSKGAVLTPIPRKGGD